jgi:hypothetical protein
MEKLKSTCRAFSALVTAQKWSPLLGEQAWTVFMNPSTHEIAFPANSIPMTLAESASRPE